MLARRMAKTAGDRRNGSRPCTAWRPRPLCAQASGIQCVVYMGSVDVKRQQPNVMRMKALGAEVIGRSSPAPSTLKDAMNEALRDWVTNVARHVLLHRHRGRAASLSDAMVRDFQSVIGIETRAQMQEAEGRLPDSLDRLHRRRLQCDGPVPSISSTIESVEIYGVEAAGPRPRHEAARGVARRRASRRAARQPHLSTDGQGRPDRRGAIRSPPDLIIRASGRNTPGSRDHRAG